MGHAGCVRNVQYWLCSFVVYGAGAEGAGLRLKYRVS